MRTDDWLLDLVSPRAVLDGHRLQASRTVGGVAGRATSLLTGPSAPGPLFPSG
jgi:hypothetical protein